MKLDELNRKDLINDLDKRTKKKSMYVKNPKYLGVTSKYIVYMSVPSATGKGSYKVRIKLLDYPNLENDNDLSIEDKVRLAIDGDIKVSCQCPAWGFWGYKYIMTQLSTNHGRSENRYPKIRNPKLEGTVCKHIYIAVRGFGKWWKRIAYDISNENFIK